MAESFSLFAPAAVHDLSGSAASSRKNSADDLEDSWWAEEGKGVSFDISSLSTGAESMAGMGSRQSLSEDEFEEERDAVWEREVQIVQLSKQPQEEQSEDAVLTRGARMPGARRAHVNLLGDIFAYQEGEEVSEVEVQLCLKGLVCESQEEQKAARVMTQRTTLQSGHFLALPSSARTSCSSASCGKIAADEFAESFPLPKVCPYQASEEEEMPLDIAPSKMLRRSSTVSSWEVDEVALERASPSKILRSSTTSSLEEGLERASPSKILRSSTTSSFEDPVKSDAAAREMQSVWSCSTSSSFSS